jgi:hypothetical protein
VYQVNPQSSTTLSLASRVGRELATRRACIARGAGQDVYLAQ